MQVEKLMQLSDLQNAGKNARVLMHDGSVMTCKPDWWSEEEEGLAYSVRLIDSWNKYKAGSLLTIYEKMITSVNEL